MQNTYNYVKSMLLIFFSENINPTKLLSIKNRKKLLK